MLKPKINTKEQLKASDKQLTMIISQKVNLHCNLVDRCFTKNERQNFCQSAVGQNNENNIENTTNKNRSRFAVFSVS